LASGLLVMGAVVACENNEAATSTVDVAGISRGSYIVNYLVGCADCHTSDPTKPFAGGVQFPIDGAGHYVYSRNLTPDPGTGMTLTQDQFVAVFQTGEDFKNHGQALFVMPWPSLRWMTTDDIKAVYTFLQQLPAVSNQVPADNKGPFAAQGPVPLPTQFTDGEETRPLPPANSPDPLSPPNQSSATPDPGHALLGAAIMPLAYAKMPNFAKRTGEEQASFGRGSYLVNAAGCGDCHTNKNGSSRNFMPGPDFLKIPADSYLIGGATYSVPTALNTVLMETRSMSQDLIGKTGGYFNRPTTTYLQFASEIDEIAHSDDNPPLSLGWPMPAGHLRNLSDQDLEDIYNYMRILAQDYDHTGQADKATQDPARYCATDSDCKDANQKCFVDSSSSKTVNNQCLTQSCTADSDCDACQKCVNKACQAPSASDSCISGGI
jgi:mono/diheme cytochrome c family protein